MRSFQQSLDQLSARGVRVVAISVDPPEESRELARKRGYTYPILSDEKMDVIRKYDLVHTGGGNGGADIARPAEFLLAGDGVVRWVNLTDNYKTRATPAMVLKALDEIESSTGTRK